MSDENDLDVTQGDNFSLTVIYEVGTPAAPVDVTGYSAEMLWKTRAGVTVTKFTSDTEDPDGTGAITVGTTDGTFVVVLPPSETVGLPAGDLVYDFHVVPPAGEENHMGVGEVTLTEGLVKVKQRRAPP